MINALIMVLVVLLTVGAGAGYLYRNEAIRRGRVRAEQAFGAWRQLFFDQNDFNKHVLVSHRDALTPGEYLYFQALVQDIYEYYQKNPTQMPGHQVPDNVIQFPVTEDDDAPER
ncbi:hypothetical protein LCGC14_0857260 [marine sediment metagenome]|uniref:Uncharacterized protein n=1 Tax=marine sediment metagenome TaxID=412755 RepID=A0A0F9P8E0_9ZZZZ